LPSGSAAAGTLLGSRQWPLLDILPLSILRTRFDWPQARQRGHDRQKVSLCELKEEFKQTEGDPAINGKMEQVQQVRRRRRMIAAVPKATVSTKE
jgi:flagellar biosynthesis protein FlhB